MKLSVLAFLLVPSSLLGAIAAVSAQSDLPWSDPNARSSRNGNGNGNGKEIVFMTKGGTSDASDAAGFPSVEGEMEDIQRVGGRDLEDIPVIKLLGLKQNPNQPVVFRKVSSNTEEVPTQVDSSDTVTATYWYGEEVGHGVRTFSLVSGADGSIIGSCTDGETSYMIQSDDTGSGSNGALKLKYWATDLADLPSLDEEAEGGRNLATAADAEELADLPAMLDEEPEGGRNLATATSGLRGAGPATELHYKERNLQTTYIRVMFYFTSLSRSRLGDNGCTNYAYECINDLNQILVNSGLPNIKFQYAGWYFDSSFNDANGIALHAHLNALKTPGDGYFDYAHYFQSTYKIDVVVAVGEYVYTGAASNQGETRASPYPLSYGYAEMKRYRGPLAGDHLFAHEMGHILGGCHDITQVENCPAAARGVHYGYSSTCYRSVMAYYCASGCSTCTVWPKFTNGQSYEGGKNNAYYMNQFAPTIAGLY